MKRPEVRYLPLVLASLMLIGVSDAWAQLPTGYQGRKPVLRRSSKPAVSPYMNLAVAGGNANLQGYAYFNLVRPEQRALRAQVAQQREIQQLNQNIEQQRRELQQSANSALGGTGHRTQFMNYGGYFNK